MLRSRWCLLAVLVMVMMLRRDQVSAQEKAAAQPEGYGLSAKYPGDVGIQKDPDVIFVESFEGHSLEALAGNWDQFNTEITSLSGDRPPESAGKKSLLFTHVGGKSEGGHLWKCPSLSPGYDQWHLRFYVKFDPDCAPISHFVGMGGYNPPSPWPLGGAGLRPAGDKGFWTGIEPYGDAWVWDYYTYWMEMRGSPPRGQTWGNNFIHDPNLKAARGQWTCVEVMMKVNDVGDSNGEMALWIDGKQVSHLGKGYPKGKWIYDKFLPGEGGEGLRWNDETGQPDHFQVPPGGQPFEGFRWRSSDDLKLNFLCLLVYMPHAPEGHVSKIWLDDVVLARKYIGPLKAR